MTADIAVPCARCGHVEPGKVRPEYLGQRYCLACYLAVRKEAWKQVAKARREWVEDSDRS